ncbi:MULTISPECIES: BlaI/MecI/CopY family transcriptional regulator [Pedobacter]|uniref:Penicillinase repressor n=1 Tax=Pedobacter heparinus (strain ATCC 13125 / DSM 2366 / CIP 104194 / JCM 7457 / NBRC 12017 / NCIMB 9290 / NRRL B-14731 / HIM 762-3) TaxID=485917 RepID=C6Y3T0_PEDHD|nr:MULTISPECIES: BlaI/MecI/CopY family transcriptional regulator [Pedobacter]ACU03359.1 Penicillinase repressor [Pedobacter heparinus DSM 2366]MBB5441128.1 putative transcriptional regulator [Pedobacter sp. AK017]
MTGTANLKPTESELEILQILWEKGDCTVRDVHEVLEKNKDAGYTTTLKLMQIMHEKGLVARDTSAKTHIYSALINQQKTQQHLVNKMIDNVFNGSAARMVIQALGNHKASKDEIDSIKKYLDELSNQ